MKYSGYYNVTFRGINCGEKDLLVKQRPNIPAPKRRITKIQVAGRDGYLIQAGEEYEPVEIPIQFNFMSEKRDSWMEVFRRARAWLRGSGTLELSDDPDFFYKVLYVEISDSERTSRRIGNFTANFICEPFNYLRSGVLFMDPDAAAYNPYMVAHPVYKISGSGNTTLTVNGNAIAVSVSDELTIDTDLMIAYKSSGEVTNTAISGDYEDLYLQEGANTISIGSGFSLTVQPNWRAI